MAYVCMVTHIARVWFNRVRLPILLMRLNKEMDAAVELGRNHVSKYHIQPEYGDMTRLTQDVTAESVSRDQIFRRERGKGNIFSPVQLTTSRIGNLTWLILTVAV